MTIFDENDLCRLFNGLVTLETKDYFELFFLPCMQVTELALLTKWSADDLVAINDPVRLFFLGFVEYHDFLSHQDFTRHLGHLSSGVLKFAWLERKGYVKSGGKTKNEEKIELAEAGKRLVHAFGLPLPHIDRALETVSYLSDIPASVYEMFTRTLDLCREKRFGEAMKFARELYDLGLGQSDSHIQGIANFLMGSISFALGEHSIGWESAIDYYEQSARLFSTDLSCNCSHNAGIVWLSIAYVREKQCKEIDAEKWERGIEAYSRAVSLFELQKDPLERLASDSRRQMILRFDDWRAGKQQRRQCIMDMKASSQSTSAVMPATIKQRSIESTARAGIPMVLVLSLILSTSLAVICFLYLTLPAFLDNSVFYGSFAGALIFALIPMACLIEAEQFFHPLLQTQVAIVEYRNRVWLIDHPRRLWLIPFLEQMSALFSTDKRTAETIFHKYLRHKNVTVETHVCVEYFAADPLLFWDDLARTIERHRSLLLDHPLRDTEVYAYLDGQMQKTTKRLLQQAADDARREIFFEENTKLETYLGHHFPQHVNPMGLQISQVTVFMRQI